MCGIAGIVCPGRLAVSLSAAVERMCAALHHRGPDGNGTYVADGIALGHARLAIIDLSTMGRQPMTNEDGSLHLVVNGEIYNYIDLRADLQARGHVFKSHSDSEVILHLYEEYGDDCVQRLDGMFALALWDAPRRRLLLARDRFGIKPLYVAQQGETLAFASELGALRRGGTAAADIDPEAVHAYMALSYVPAPSCVFRGTQKLLPAERAVWANGQLRRQTYWSPRPVHVPSRRADAVEALAQGLEASVRAHLVADVPVAAFLSGGVDSSTVVALAQRHAKMETLCVAFPDPGLNEAPLAAAVASHLGTKHHEVALHLDPVTLLSQAVACMDEPFADSSALPTFALCRAARELGKVVLSGDGGDEVFGGYTGRYRVSALKAAVPWPGALARVLRRVPPWRSGRRGALPMMLGLASLPDVERFLWERQITTTQERAALFGATRHREAEQRLREVPAAAIRHAAGWHPVHRALWIDLATSLPDDMLTKVDRMSMAHGLEVRVPLLDHHVVEFALALPPAWLVSALPVEGKRLLRQVAAPLLPPRILDRPKQGFVVPLNRWIQSHFRPLVDEYCLAPDAAVATWMDGRSVSALLHSPVGETPRQDLYALLVLELWLRRLRESTDAR
jgi:asparagine synthase (glutamine-hydrolysing)